MPDNSQTIKRLAILGSTGSIGQQALEIVRALPENFRVVGLAAGKNLQLLKQQITEFKPEIYYADVSTQAPIDGAQPVFMEEMAAYENIDVVLISTSGRAGLNPLIAAIKANKTVALANKEPLVMAGEIIQAEMKKHQGWILPVDSEHSAIWQCLSGESQSPARLILTASGGPFLRYSVHELADVTVELALKHPSWKMGRKVTIDSATLMNKGLEVIEAHWLFDMPFDKIDILIHPQSIVHSMVEMADGSIKAQLSYPDMRLPIQFALTYPGRLANTTFPKLDWKNIKNLAFEIPDYDRFPCLKLAIAAGKQGGTLPAALCAADEAAVELFLNGKIRFLDIPVLLEKVLNLHSNRSSPNLEEILHVDRWSREQVKRLAGGDN
jgi:1-deoxy-D-xylulose-5-phosphate reductoisomerase